MNIIQPTAIKVLPWGSGIAVVGVFAIQKGVQYTIESTDDGVTWYESGATKQNGTGPSGYSMFLATEVLAPFARLVGP